MAAPKTLAELAEESGVPARTIRFYIARGLLAGPGKAGRGAVYTGEHLARLQQIKQLQAGGRTLLDIAREMGEKPARAAAPPSACWQHVIGDDVVILVRGGVSPWRMKRIQAAIDEFAARLWDGEGDSTRRDQE